jgi:serine/threonine-protein kinase HipA
MRPLDQLRFVERAAVLKQGARAGSLERRRDAVVFTYDDGYRRSGGPPVATTLPFSADPVVTHAPGALPPFFSGLLPEGRRLTALRQAVKTSADDELTLLLAVGGDAIGDVQIVPDQERAIDVAALATVSDWSEVRFADLLAASVGGSAPVDRVAIPGVQDKVSARMINVPVARANSRFMLKLDPPEFPHLVTNEAFFLEAGRRSGLEMADAEVVRDAEGTLGLLVRRFDRVPAAEGGVAMLAQEDACQVLGRYPADKYRVTTEDVIGALAGVCRARPVAALALLEQFAFAYLTRNGDAHAKNFSVRRDGGEWRPTPMYDVPTSYVYGDHTMALTLNGKSKEDVGREDFIALGRVVGVRTPAVERALDELCEGVGLWIDELAGLPFDPGLLRKLRHSIEYRRERLGRRPGHPAPGAPRATEVA